MKYWPNRQNDKISFFAYAPYESDWQNGSKSGVITSAATAPGIPYIKFKLKTTDKLDKMVDLVVADQRDKTYTAENGGKISFTFEHTLSRISFRAQLGAGDFDGMDGTNSFVYITHMWIVGTDHSADGSNRSLIDPARPLMRIPNSTPVPNGLNFTGTMRRMPLLPRQTSVSTRC